MLKLCINSRDELFVLDLDKVAYIQASGNYSRIVYIGGMQMMVALFAYDNLCHNGGDEGGGGGQGLALGLLGDDLHQEQGAAGADHVHGDTREDDVRLQVEGI